MAPSGGRGGVPCRIASTSTPDDDLPARDVVLSDDERAAMRAFLQRCEVRLSTMHRVATALLSGAGILVLLPAVERDSVIQVLRLLLTGPITWPRALLALAVGLSIGLALAVLWLVIMELTRFYFHANHVVHTNGEVFTPRFTLTGLRLPSDELQPGARELYHELHGSEQDVQLLVPGNDRARGRIDRQLAAYPGLVERTDGMTGADADRARAEALFELAASRQRLLIEEVTKVEYGMVRHMLRLQVIILRYVKALLIIVVTSVATYVAAAAVTNESSLSVADQRWIAATMAIWAPLVVLAATSPVRWLESLLRTEGAEHTAVRDDVELTQVQDVTTRVAAVAWVASVVAMVLLLVDDPVSQQGWWASIAALVISTGLAVVAVVRGRAAP